MNGGDDNQWSMDGSLEPERADDWGDQGLSATKIEQITQDIYQRLKNEMAEEAVRASREAFIDLISMLSLRKIVNEQKRDRGWVDNYKVDQEVAAVREDIRDFFNRSDLANTFNIEGMVNDLGKLMDFAGILDEEKFEDRMEELNRNFKIVTDMIADPHLALTERVKSFQLK